MYIEENFYAEYPDLCKILPTIIEMHPNGMLEKIGERRWVYRSFEKREIADILIINSSEKFMDVKLTFPGYGRVDISVKKLDGICECYIGSNSRELFEKFKGVLKSGN